MRVGKDDHVNQVLGIEDPFHKAVKSNQSTDRMIGALLFYQQNFEERTSDLPIFVFITAEINPEGNILLCHREIFGQKITIVPHISINDVIRIVSDAVRNEAPLIIVMGGSGHAYTGEIKLPKQYTDKRFAFLLGHVSLVEETITGQQSP